MSHKTFIGAGLLGLSIFISSFIVPAEVSAAGCVNLTYGLGLGSTGASVSQLQGFLKDQGYLSANATGYFGTLTRNAVIAFQNANGLSPVGTVGPMTRAKIQTISCGTGGATTPLSPTVDLRINGSNGPVTLSSGQSVVMSWTSQNATNCTVGAPINQPAALSSSGKTATFAPGTENYPSASGTTYSITCSNGTKTVSDSVNVGFALGAITTNCQGTTSGCNASMQSSTCGGVGQPVCIPNGGQGTASQAVTADLKVNNSDGPVTINFGQDVTLSWTSVGASSCTLGVFGSDAAVLLGTSGSITYTPNTSYYPGNGATFRIACTNSTGAQTGDDFVAVSVNGNNSAPIIKIKANNSITPITVNSGDVVSLVWLGEAQNSAYVTCLGSGVSYGGTDQTEWNSLKSISGSKVVRPTQTTTYAIQCTSPSGSANDSITVNVNNGNANTPTVTFTASPMAISSGQSSTLTWSSTNATNCTASGAWSGTKATSGTVSTGALTVASNTFTLTCTGAGGSATANAKVATTQSTSPIVTLTATPSTILSGQSSMLSWSSINTTNCTASGAWSGSKTISGSESTGTLTANGSYTLTCFGTNGSANSTAVVSIGTPDPTVTLTASPTSIASGLTTNLTWTSTNANSCTASGDWSGTKTTSGTQASNPLAVGVNTFTISCSSATRTVSATAIVTGINTQTTNKFTIGNRVFVRADVNARPNPTISSTPASLHPVDDLGVVVDGPIVADGFTWWKIDYVTGVDGWTAQDNLGLGGVSFTPVSKIFYFNTSQSNIKNGESATLSWYANATNCGVFQNASDQWAIGGGYMPGVVSGNPGVTSMTVAPASTWTYTLKCYKDFGSYAQGSPTVTQPLTITVNEGMSPSISSFTISPSVITSGNSSTLSWSASANSCKVFQETYQRGGNAAVSQIISSGNTTGTLSVSPKTLGTFTLVCERSRQTVSRSVAVTSDLPNDPAHDTSPSQGTVTANLKANGSTGTNNIVSVVQGTDITLTWDALFSSSIAGGVATCSTSAGNTNLGSIGSNGSVTLSKTHQFYPKVDGMMNVSMTCMGTDSTFKTFSASKDIMVKLIQQ